MPNTLGTAPGQRCRIESWAPLLENAGWKIDFYPFEDSALHEVLYTPGHFGAKVAGMARCYGRQLRRVLAKPPCDVALVFREAALIGPAVLERLLLRLRVPLVYDIDDPVFLPYRSPSNTYFSFLKLSRKTHSLFRIAERVISINRIIGDYALRFNANVDVVPNFVDTDVYRPGTTTDVAQKPTRLGWIGSVSTMGNLQGLVEPLRHVQRTHDAPLRVIGIGSAQLPGVAHEVYEWSASTEVALLQGCDVGLVPLPDAPWNHWKFFLKVIQYMAVGIPVVAQRMGSNPDVIDDGVDGFVVDTERDWIARLQLLAGNPQLRRRMGQAARQKAVSRYSSSINMQRVDRIFRGLLRQTPRGAGGAC